MIDRSKHCDCSICGATSGMPLAPQACVLHMDCCAAACSYVNYSSSTADLNISCRFHCHPNNH